MLPDNWCMRLLTYYSYCMYISEIPRHYQCSGFFFLIFRNHTFHLWDIETALCWLCTYTRNPTISLISNHSECVSLCCVTMCESNFYLFICTVLIVTSNWLKGCDHNLSWTFWNFMLNSVSSNLNFIDLLTSEIQRLWFFVMLTS